MSNTEIIIQLLASVDFQTAKTAIKSFYKATLQDKIALQKTIEDVANAYTQKYAEKRPLVHGTTVLKRDEPPVIVDEKSVVGTEELAKATCPRCGDSLEYSAVCPACAAGKAGYPHRYSCVCGVSFVTQEKL